MRNRPDSSDSAAVRLIKKYPNRRLYDSRSSAYITLTDIKSLVLEQESFVVRDAKTDEDLTRSILLQIILDEEAAGTPMLSEAALSNIIRFYGHTMQGFLGTYLENNVQAFADLQSRFTEQSNGFSPETWAQFMGRQSPMLQSMMGSYVHQSQSAMVQMQERMQQQTQQMLDVFGLNR